MSELIRDLSGYEEMQRTGIATQLKPGAREEGGRGRSFLPRFAQKNFAWTGSLAVLVAATASCFLLVNKPDNTSQVEKSTITTAEQKTGQGEKPTIKSVQQEAAQGDESLIKSAEQKTAQGGDPTTTSAERKTGRGEKPDLSSTTSERKAASRGRTAGRNIGAFAEKEVLITTSAR